MLANYQTTKYTLIKQNIKIWQDFTIFQNFSKFGAMDFCDFSGSDAFSALFSGRSRKILKNSALAVKFGVDTADILLFQIEKRILIFWKILEVF